MPTLTLSTSLTSLFKLQTRKTCQQWPQGNDKMVLCCLLAGEKQKSIKKKTKTKKQRVMLSRRLSAWQCLSRIVKDLVCQCKDFWGGGGHEATVFFFFLQITATSCAAHSAHVIVVFALWHSDRVNVLVLIINVAEMEAIFSIFPQITESSPTEREDTERGREREK